MLVATTFPSENKGGGYDLILRLRYTLAYANAYEPVSLEATRQSMRRWDGRVGSKPDGRILRGLQHELGRSGHR